MQLIHALAAGIPNCPNGSAQLYRRGTSTRATWYTDFEASSANSSGSDLALDASGSAVAYVNELVLVVVFDSQGEEQRSFVAGEGAYAVEVISQSFTGADYTTGQHGALKPTTAGDIFDLWKASAGTLDWNVLISGASDTIQNALGLLYGIGVNVKSPKYGAKGDGTTNDAAAIQAAHDAMALNGGGCVFVPPGTYNLSGAINWNMGVSLLCVPGTVLFRVTTAGQRVISLSSALFTPKSATVFYGLRCGSTVTNSADMININVADFSELQIENCYFGDNNNSIGIAINNQTGTMNFRLLVRNCEFHLYADVIALLDASSSGSGEVVFEDNRLYTNGAGAQNLSLVETAASRLTVRGNSFYWNSSGGSAIIVDSVSVAAGFGLLVQGNRFEYLTGATGTPNGVRVKNGATVIVSDDNEFDSHYTRYFKTGANDILAFGSYLALQPMVQATTVGSPTVPNGVRAVYYTSTGAGVPAVTMPESYYPGQPLDVIMVVGGSWGSAVTFSAPGTGVMAYDQHPTTLSSSQHIAWRFVFAGSVSGSPQWVQVNATPAVY